MKKNFKEKDFQSLFTKWFKIHGWTFPYELKVNKGKTVPFSKFEPQQLPSLWKAYNGIFHHKLTDASLGAKPFDGYGYKNVDAYVGIIFEKDKQQTIFYLIHIKKIMRLKETGAKSISLAFAKDNGIEINLKDI